MKKLLWLLTEPLIQIAFAFSWLLSKPPINSTFAKELLSSAYLGKASRAKNRKDFEKAFHYFNKIIVLDASESIMNLAFEELGSLYENGLGTEKDKEMAEECYLRAGFRGDRSLLHSVATRSYNEKYK